MGSGWIDMKPAWIDIRFAEEVIDLNARSRKNPATPFSIGQGHANDASPAPSITLICVVDPRIVRMYLGSSAQTGPKMLDPLIREKTGDEGRVVNLLIEIGRSDLEEKPLGQGDFNQVFGRHKCRAISNAFQ